MDDSYVDPGFEEFIRRQDKAHLQVQKDIQVILYLYLGFNMFGANMHVLILEYLLFYTKLKLAGIQ